MFVFHAAQTAEQNRLGKNTNHSNYKEIFTFVKRLYYSPKTHVEMIALVFPRLEMSGISCGPT